MHCNLRQPDAAQSLSALISSSVPSLNSLSLSVAVLECFTVCTLCYTLWSWTLTSWPWPLTFDLRLYSRPAVPWSNSVRNLSAIGQSAAALLLFDYLTLWPLTCITCCAMLWDSLDIDYTQSIYPFMCPNSVQNLSEIEQSATELLQFEYLTLCPLTCITCCAMLWDSLHKV